MTLAEAGDGAEIGRVERHYAHEIDPLPARLGDAARGVDCAAVGIEQQRRHHHRVERRLALLAGIAGRDLSQVQLLGHQTHHEAGEMVFGHKVPHARRQKLRLVDLPVAKCLAHAPAMNLSRAPRTSEKNCYYSDTLLAGPLSPSRAGSRKNRWRAVMPIGALLGPE